MSVLSNPKWERFAQELAKGKTADEAYVLAGYRESRKNASRLRTNEDVTRRIEEILSRAAERTEITVSQVIAELAKIGFADIRKAVRWGEGIAVPDTDGEAHIVHDVALLSSDAIDADTAAAISEVRKTKEGVSIKFHDKRAALVDLGRHLGAFKDKIEHSGPNGMPIQSMTLTPDQFEAVARKVADDI